MASAGRTGVELGGGARRSLPEEPPLTESDEEEERLPREGHEGIGPPEERRPRLSLGERWLPVELPPVVTAAVLAVPAALSEAELALDRLVTEARKRGLAESGAEVASAPDQSVSTPSCMSISS